MTTVQELKLIARCVAFDDRNAFGQLVKYYEDPVKRFIYSLTQGDALLTDDIAQETFVKSWLSIRQFKGIARFKTWLFKIAYNEYLSWTRNNSKTETLKEYLEYDLETEEETKQDAKIDIQRLLQCLNEKERTIVILFYIEGQSIKKIVEITRIPEGTVKVYLSRSRERIKTLILQDERTENR